MGKRLIQSICLRPMMMEEYAPNCQFENGNLSQPMICMIEIDRFGMMKGSSIFWTISHAHDQHCAHRVNYCPTKAI